MRTAMMGDKENLTFGQLVLFGLGSLLGAIAGIWALRGLAEAMTAQAPGFWFVSRAAGIAAYLLLWGSTAWGIMLSSKGVGGLVSGPLAYALHNVVSWLVLGFSVVHGLALLGDRVVPFTLAGVVVPFASDYQTLLTGLGTLSLWIGILVAASFYLRQKLAYRIWRTVHGLSYLMFVSVTVHSLLLGTDSSTLPMRLVYVLAGSSVLYLTVFRVLTKTNLKVI